MPFDWPQSYYGENLNALWDCLTGWIELPLTLVWKNFEASQKALGSDAEDVLELLQEAQEELGNRFVIQYMDRNRKPETFRPYYRIEK